MRKIVVNQGDKFGRLTVIEEAERSYFSGKPHRMFICECECGETSVVALGKLRSGHTTSCGCLVSTACSDRNRTHGLSGSPEYGIWCSIKERCNNPNNIAYVNYGKRNIYVCERWVNSFENFFSDMGSRPTKKHSIERRSVDGPYSPENCCWATSVEQANNKRNNRRITYNGETQSLSKWCTQLCIPYRAVMARLIRGASIEKAFAEPFIDPKAARKFIEHDGKSLSIYGWSKKTGIPYLVLRARFDRGWNVHKAISQPVRTRGKLV